MDDVFVLLEKLENEFLGAKNTVFSKKAMVDAQRCLQYITEIKNGLPSALKKAQDIIDHSTEIVASSTKKAQEILTDAENRAIEMVSQSEILKRAEHDSKVIRSDAVQYANTLKNDSRLYVDDMFADVEKFLADTIACIRNNREELRGSIVRDKKPPQGR